MCELAGQGFRKPGRDGPGPLTRPRPRTPALCSHVRVTRREHRTVRPVVCKGNVEESAPLSAVSGSFWEAAARPSRISLRCPARPVLGLWRGACQGLQQLLLPRLCCSRPHGHGELTRLSQSQSLRLRHGVFPLPLCSELRQEELPPLWGIDPCCCPKPPPPPSFLARPLTFEVLSCRVPPDI